MYRWAYGYLRRLKPVLGRLAEQAVTWHEMLSSAPSITDPPMFENFSGSLLIRYLLCWANYYYLLDRCDRSHETYRGDLPSEANAHSAIQEAWTVVNKAEKLVAVRLAKYRLISEISQGTFQPHYTLLAKIYFLRLRLLLFFPRMVPIDRTYLPTDATVTTNRRDINAIYSGWLYLLEKARLYATCSGDQELYSCYTAYQSCIYIMASLQDQPIRLCPSEPEIPFSASHCLSWAKRLRNHAILSYAKTGRHCYYQIKEKSGISQSLSRRYGIYSIQEIPPIREMRNQDNERPGLQDTLLYIDMELLSI
ncbi:MAG: hypothetical protein MUF49_10595 [Oculatellaceae cyanobacterium Prado106]|jgi:hypothetical protein|nr:hypothetical protein [Oculatellaceae cyanobacterium Prado106]